MDAAAAAATAKATHTYDKPTVAAVGGDCSVYGNRGGTEDPKSASTSAAPAAALAGKYSPTTSRAPAQWNQDSIPIGLAQISSGVVRSESMSSGASLWKDIRRPAAR